ncbi:hypothetical protein NIIDNTM18_10120 [Mycolicibacterium litorale]|uniref:PASTA domain-containing protein n=1 Tax=Mycolicibacterium litorale TaxID=758802 RepID=A0A6S6NZ17_9MYCO|nr:hypothetical protein NIIDNTM18_10120 [Mycolicibacterium litorale]
MKARIAVGAVTFVVSVGLSAPPALAQPTQWVMPDLRGMNLAAAQKAFSSVTEGGPTLRYVNLSGPGEIINLTNWTVCRQSPAPGGRLAAKSVPNVRVNRPNNC